MDGCGPHPLHVSEEMIQEGACYWFMYMTYSSFQTRLHCKRQGEKGESPYLLRTLAPIQVWALNVLIGVP